MFPRNFTGHFFGSPVVYFFMPKIGSLGGLLLVPNNPYHHPHWRCIDPPTRMDETTAITTTWWALGGHRTRRPVIFSRFPGLHKPVKPRASLQNVPHSPSRHKSSPSRVIPANRSKGYDTIALTPANPQPPVVAPPFGVAPPRRATELPKQLPEWYKIVRFASHTPGRRTRPLVYLSGTALVY